MSNTYLHAQKNQKGAAILAFFLVMIVLAATVVLAGLKNISPHTKQQIKIQKTMADAKEALLAYAMNYQNLYPSSDIGPGRLPCPDINNDTIENCASNGGRLLAEVTTESSGPFYITDTNPGQQFWYFVTPDFLRASGTTINTGTPATLTLDNRVDIVAVLVAPGVAISSQNRLMNPLLASNYLEGSNQYGINFTSHFSPDPDVFNDHVLGITQAELMSLSTIKVADVIHDLLTEYHEDEGLDAYPIDEDTFLTLFDEAPVWLTNDEWSQVSNYNWIDDDNISFNFDNCAIIFNVSLDAGMTINPRKC